MLCLGCGIDRPVHNFETFLRSVVQDGPHVTSLYSTPLDVVRTTARVCDACCKSYTGFVEYGVKGIHRDDSTKPVRMWN